VRPRVRRRRDPAEVGEGWNRHLEATASAESPIGRALPRVEDPPLLTGEARFVADAPVPALEAVFVRSPQAHGVLREVDPYPAWTCLR